MFCPNPNCRAQIKDGAKFCSKCGTHIDVQPQTQTQPQTQSQEAPERLRGYFLRALAAVAAVDCAILTIWFIAALFGTLSDVIETLSWYESVATGVGAAAYVVCGLLLAGLSAGASMPLFRYVARGTDARPLIVRGLFASIVLFAASIACWACRLCFQDSLDLGISGALYQVFQVYGSVCSAALTWEIVALVILFIAFYLVVKYPVLGAGSIAIASYPAAPSINACVEYCPGCGAAIGEGKFCPKCGTSIN